VANEVLDKETFVEVSKDELEEVALESTGTIEIDEFVEKSATDPRYLIRLYYLRPEGKVGHDAFAVIRETIRENNEVAIGRVVLTKREHIIELEPLEKGLVGTLLRYPYEVQSEEEYFDEIQDVKVTKYMLDRAISWISSRGGSNRKSSKTIKETALIDLINQKRAGKPITPKERPANVINLMEALRRSLGKPAPTKVAKPDKKPRKAAGTQKEMLMPSPVRSNQRSRRRTSLQQCVSAGRRNR
jgi:DNA end-binding protein Ku